MAFSDFKAIPEVQERFRIKHTDNDFITVAETASTPSEQFLQELAFSRQYIDVFASESARCEAVIFPVLREVYKEYAEDYALWIKKPITYDETLSGTPDYFISTRSELGMLVVGIPLIMFVEAKKNDFEQGWGQCLAELVAAQKINADPDVPVYGIVSDGTWWQFGCLVGDAFTRNRTSFSVDNLPSLFGAINAVFKAAGEASVL
jgi:thiol-disulfide isomerase/thioredoxin